MKILLFSRNQNNHTTLAQTIRMLPVGQEPDLELRHMSEYDELRRDLVKNAYDMVLVAETGAYGMEVCVGTRKIRPRVPLVWFSDDPNFAAQSYRLNCTYFAELPVTQRTLANAFCRMMEDALPHRRWG